jgi:hypothetical protein
MVLLLMALWRGSVGCDVVETKVDLEGIASGEEVEEKDS